MIQVYNDNNYFGNYYNDNYCCNDDIIIEYREINFEF